MSVKSRKMRVKSRKMRVKSRETSADCRVMGIGSESRTLISHDYTLL
jgi:hypothetical protein